MMIVSVVASLLAALHKNRKDKSWRPIVETKVEKVVDPSETFPPAEAYQSEHNINETIQIDFLKKNSTCQRFLMRVILVRT